MEDASSARGKTDKKVVSSSKPQSKTTDSGVKVVHQHVVEFVCDSGEGAQTAGQMFGSMSARAGNGVWTVEIIPAEIEPPHRSKAGASGNRIRVGTKEITNAGDEADIVIAFNEQVLYSRIDVGALRKGTIIFLESKWRDDPLETVRAEYLEAFEDFQKRGYDVRETPMEVECLRYIADPRRGKNMWALGMLCAIYCMGLEKAEMEITKKFKRKGQKVIDSNMKLIEAGYAWATKNVPDRFEIPVRPNPQQMVVMNGNTAVALGCMAAGMELCSMYPITPATSASHYLSGAFYRVGGFVHQAEDEIASIGFALGASFAGKTPVTITSGPGLSLMTEMLGLAVMTELPLVIVDVQRGGPSTGLPTKVEQGDLLAALYSAFGDAPKIVMAPATIEECLHFMVTARKLAETFRGPVMVLTDANLATGQTPFPRPVPTEEWLSPPLDQSPWPEGKPSYDWDHETGLSQRPIPGQRGGNYVLTGLAHDNNSKVAYESNTNLYAMRARSRKLHTLRKTLKPPKVYGADTGDLLIVGWGSTKGAIEEAVDRVRADGGKVSSTILRFLSPLEPGLGEIFAKFKKVMTIEINYSDDVDDKGIDAGGRRYAQLAMVLRAATLVDVDCWSDVPGSPLPPKTIENVIRRQLKM
ncbi:MAG: 2-oxoacid:acceptor oxidoreductase subunit alpha [Deltaproteobacteria bacterium CG_4_9_14_3_um_filter_63_12]|nr:MAG: 2-oxoacid:acceptor oxidoreductase subunit alpha [Deltaproteobacteria bacterium CG_4_9_14_3_um_filter_63_12]